MCVCVDMHACICSICACVYGVVCGICTYVCVCTLHDFSTCRKIAEDGEFGLFTVTLFKKVVDEFKLHCRENK